MPSKRTNKKNIARLAMAGAGLLIVIVVAVSAQQGKLAGALLHTNVFTNSNSS